MAIWIRPGADGSVETAPLCKADASAGWSRQFRYGWNSDKPTIMGFQFNATGGDEIRAASAVNIVGRIKGDLSGLWDVPDGAEVCIEKV